MARADYPVKVELRLGEGTGRLIKRLKVGIRAREGEGGGGSSGCSELKSSLGVGCVGLGELGTGYGVGWR